jgi:hypothetical protein
MLEHVSHHDLREIRTALGDLLDLETADGQAID